VERPSTQTAFAPFLFKSGWSTLFSTAASHFDTKEGAVLASVVATSLHICSGSLDLLQYDIGIFAGFDGFESQRSQHNFWVDTIFVPFFFFMS